MVAAFENWSLAEGRKEGDVGIVETTYGYHIMYHIAATETTWSDTIKEDLATEEQSEFAEKLSTADNVKIENEDQSTLDLVKEEVVKLAKQQARNISSASAY